MQPKRKVKCVICGEWFIRWNSFQKVCKNPGCIIENAKIQKEKQARKDKKKFLDSDRSHLTKKAQEVFNRFIRLRDGNKCITCGATNRQIHAGHYLPVGRNSKLRFNELNCHSQCVICNSHLSGNLTAYRDVMIAKYGLEKVEGLESDRGVHKFTVDELKDIIKTYKQKAKDIENERQNDHEND